MKHRFIDMEATTDGEASALGTGETDGTGGTSSAGTQNTDTGAGGQPPETIPYSRFKEVNDAYSELKPFKELADTGYDADSLRQLAEFEAGFRADPVSTWYAIATQIDDMPEEVRSIAQQHLSGETTSATPTDQTPRQNQEGEEIPEWAKPLTQNLEQLSAAERARQEREVSDANNQLLDGILQQWKKLDEADELPSLDDRKKLTYIVAHSRGARDVSEILQNARGEWLETREEMLGSAIKPGANAGAPRSVPSGGAPVNTAGEPKTLAEASARAKARLEQLGSE
jgi:hypothetical protein